MSSVYKAGRPGTGDAEREALGRLARLGILGAVLLEDVALGTTEVDVAHGLGRRLRVWLLADQDADARVWRSGTADARFLPLTASAAVTVSLLVW